MNLEGDFAAIWQQCSQQLVEAVSSAKHEWHLLTLSNVNDRAEADSRIVVLRYFDSAVPSLAFHTDYRSPKIKQLSQHPHCSLLLYSRELRRQLRLQCKVRIHHQNSISSARWHAAAKSSKRCYMVQPSPSKIMDERRSTLPAAFIKAVPSHDQSAEFYENFCVVECDIKKADILQLNAQGGERCELTFSKQGKVLSGAWVAP